MLKTALHFVSVAVYTAVLSANLLAKPQTNSFNHPLVFEPNFGQTGPEVQWVGQGPRYRMFITSDSATFISSDATSSLRMKLRGSSPWQATGQERTGGVSNYFVGNDSKQWRTNIPHYARLRIADVYRGIDLVFYDHNGDLEYDFIVSPGADPGQIRLAFDGAERMRLDDAAGDLVLTTSIGAEFRTHRPKVFQDIDIRRLEVAGGYEIRGHGEAAFTLAS